MDLEELRQAIKDDPLYELRQELPEGWKVGYIGNCERWGDDRSWRLFTPAKTRTGYSTSVGDYPTEHRERLIELWRSGKAIAYLNRRLESKEWQMT